MNVDTLVQAAQAGDELAFEQVVDRCYDIMYRYAFKWCGNQAHAEDITQQACIKLARSIHQYRFEAAFTSWLYRLVVNCAKDWLKSQQRHNHQDCDNAETRTDQANATTNNSAETAIYLSQILELVDGFGEGFKETVVLVLGEGFTHQEAAEILEVKESTISWRIHEVRKKLNLLAKEEAGL